MRPRSAEDLRQRFAKTHGHTLPKSFSAPSAFVPCGLNSCQHQAEVPQSQESHKARTHAWSSQGIVTPCLSFLLHSSSLPELLLLDWFLPGTCFPSGLKTPVGKEHS